MEMKKQYRFFYKKAVDLLLAGGYIREEKTTKVNRYRIYDVRGKVGLVIYDSTFKKLKNVLLISTDGWYYIDYEAVAKEHGSTHIRKIFEAKYPQQYAYTVDKIKAQQRRVAARPAILLPLPGPINQAADKAS